MGQPGHRLGLRELNSRGHVYVLWAVPPALGEWLQVSNLLSNGSGSPDKYSKGMLTDMVRHQQLGTMKKVTGCCSLPVSLKSSQKKTSFLVVFVFEVVSYSAC